MNERIKLILALIGVFILALVLFIVIDHVVTGEDGTSVCTNTTEYINVTKIEKVYVNNTVYLNETPIEEVQTEPDNKYLLRIVRELKACEYRLTEFNTSACDNVAYFNSSLRICNNKLNNITKIIDG